MIISPEIERLEITNWKETQSQENARHDIAALRRLRQLHIEADYADELLETVKSLLEYISGEWGADKDGSRLVKAHALIAKIGVK